MPDSVRCTFDSTHTFTCEVNIGPDPAPSANSQASAASTPAASSTPASMSTATANAQSPADTAVASLVERYTKTIVLPTPDEPYVTGKALLDCAGSEASVLLAGAALKTGPLAVLTMLKASFDTGKCLALESNAASLVAGQKEAADDCEARGGNVTGVSGSTTYCEVDRSAQ